jgi:fermentation-respiration switch protein FrsA (DUF1100 family)
VLFYLANAVGPVPCVVMGHGTTGTMSFGLDRYARRFVGAGFAVLTFDYRHFGASEGVPRQVINVQEQPDDWRSALGAQVTVSGG